MMNAVIVDAKNTMLPVPNSSSSIVKPRAYSTLSMPVERLAVADGGDRDDGHVQAVAERPRGRSPIT